MKYTFIKIAQYGYGNLYINKIPKTVVPLLLGATVILLPVSVNFLELVSTKLGGELVVVWTFRLRGATIFEYSGLSLRATTSLKDARCSPQQLEARNGGDVPAPLELLTPITEAEGLEAEPIAVTEK